LVRELGDLGHNLLGNKLENIRASFIFAKNHISKGIRQHTSIQKVWMIVQQLEGLPQDKKLENGKKMVLWDDIS
jgi:hypothetical protein